MEQGRIRQTPTGYGVIKVEARKQITVPTVDVPALAHTTSSTARFASLDVSASVARLRAAQ